MGNGPASWNLRHFADRIVNQRRLCFCAIVGDSTCATNQGGGSGGQARWAYGWIREADVNWAQYVAWDISTAGLEGSSSIFLPGSGVEYGDTLNDATTTNPFPLAIAENSVTAGGVHSNNFGRVLLQLTTAAYKGGDWTASQTIRVTRYNTFATNNWAVGCHQLIVNNSGGAVESGIVESQAIWGSTPGTRNTFSHPDFARNSTQATNITLNLLNHTAGGPATGNCYKTRFKVHNTATGLGITKGFGWASVSQGGWGTRDHLDKYDQTACNHEVAAMGYNVIIIQLGINIESGEASANLSTTVYRDNLRLVAEKYQAALIASGVADPMIVIQNPWTAGGSPGSNYINSMNEWAIQIARQLNSTRCPVAFLSIERLIRGEGGDNWYDATGNGVPYLADSVHQATAGAISMVRLVQAECRRQSKPTGPMSRSRYVRGRSRKAA